MTSLRQIAAELGITPAYLSYMVNGKRPWREDLYERYSQLVNTDRAAVNNDGGGLSAKTDTKQRVRSTRHLHGVQGVVGSNPIAPTNIERLTRLSSEITASFVIRVYLSGPHDVQLGSFQAYLLVQR